MKQLKSLMPPFWLMPHGILGIFVRNPSKPKLLYLKRIRSPEGKLIEGLVVMCPLASDYTNHPLREDFILDKIIESGQLAMEHGAKIVGFDAFLSKVVDKHFEAVSRRLKIPFTCGDALLAWSIFEGIFRLTKAKKIDLKKVNVAIIGAAQPALSLCARKLSYYVNSLILVDELKDKLEDLKMRILKLNRDQDTVSERTQPEVTLEPDAHKAVLNAEVVVYGLDEPGLESDILHDLKTSTIFCHVAGTSDFLYKNRLPNEISFFEAGLVKLPCVSKQNRRGGYRLNTVPARLAETMVLACEERFATYSVGENTNLDRLEEIADMAVHCGFEMWVPEAPVL
jgi:fatty aldehyde-generating acyl-ACP reductase